MEQQDQLNIVKRVHDTILRITNVMKVVPFVYSLIFIIIFTVYNFASVPLQEVLDALFYISPAVVLMHVIYSKILHLCKWHRIVCIIPLIPQALNLLDTFLHFTQYEVITTNVIAIVLSVILIISAYKVFIYG